MEENRFKSLQYCKYYQATVERSKTWFFTAALRACEHLAFDRTLDSVTGVFEFFVPDSNTKDFLNFMSEFETLGIIKDLKELENRLI